MKNRRRILTGGGKKFLWIYESGDSKLQNCSYSLTQRSDYLDFPPLEVGSTQLTDFFRYRYVQNEETSPSTAGYLDLTVAKTFAGFKKLCFEAKKTSSKVSASTTFRVASFSAGAVTFSFHSFICSTFLERYKNARLSANTTATTSMVLVLVNFKI